MAKEKGNIKANKLLEGKTKIEDIDLDDCEWYEAALVALDQSLAKSGNHLAKQLDPKNPQEKRLIIDWLLRSREKPVKTIGGVLKGLTISQESNTNNGAEPCSVAQEVARKITSLD